MDTLAINTNTTDFFDRPLPSLFKPSPPPPLPPKQNEHDLSALLASIPSNFPQQQQRSSSPLPSSPRPSSLSSTSSVSSSSEALPIEASDMYPGAGAPRQNGAGGGGSSIGVGQIFNAGQQFNAVPGGARPGQIMRPQGGGPAAPAPAFGPPRTVPQAAPHPYPMAAAGPQYPSSASPSNSSFSHRPQTPTQQNPNYPSHLRATGPPQQPYQPYPQQPQQQQQQQERQPYPRQQHQHQHPQPYPQQQRQVSQPQHLQHPYPQQQQQHQHQAPVTRELPPHAGPPQQRPFAHGQHSNPVDLGSGPGDNGPLLEMIEGEEKYVTDLENIIKKVAGAWSRTNFPPKVLDGIFRAVEGIYKTNKAFGVRLGALDVHDPSPKALGDVLIGWVDELSGPYHRYASVMYSNFNSMPSVYDNLALHQILATLTDTNPPSPAVLKNAAVPDHPTDWTLDTFFIIPYLRLRYYKRMYARLLRGAEPGRSDHRMLGNANDVLQEILTVMERNRMRNVMDLRDGSNRPPSNASQGSEQQRPAAAPQGERASNASVSTVGNSSYETQTALSPFTSRGVDSTGTGADRDSADSIVSASVSLDPPPPKGETIAMPLGPNDRQNSDPMTPTERLKETLMDLETRLDTARTIDLFTMKPKACKLQITPPSLAYYRSLRRSAEAEVMFTPTSTQQEVIHTRGHLFVLTDLFLICEHMQAEEKVARAEEIYQKEPSRIGDGGPMPEFWLAYPPLAGRHLTVVSGPMENQLIVTVMKRERFLIQVESRRAREELLQDITSCIEFSASIAKTTKAAKSIPPVPSLKVETHTIGLGVDHQSPSGSGFSASPSPLFSPMSAQIRDRDAVNGDARSSAIKPIAGNVMSPTMEVPAPRGASLRSDNSSSNNNNNDNPHHLMPQHHDAPYRQPRHMTGGPQPQAQALFPSPSHSVSLINDGFQNLNISRSGSAPPMESTFGFNHSSPSSALRPDGAGAGAGGRLLDPRSYTQQHQPEPQGHRQPIDRSRSTEDHLRGPAPPPKAYNLEPYNSYAPNPSPTYADPSAAHAQRNHTEVHHQHQQREGEGDERDERESREREATSTAVAAPGPSKITAQMKCKLFLQQAYSQWVPIGSGSGSSTLTLYHQQTTHTKQLVVQADDSAKTMLISTLVLTSGVERVGKNGVAVEVSDVDGSKTNVVYLIQVRNEESARGLYECFLAGK